MRNQEGEKRQNYQWRIKENFTEEMKLDLGLEGWI